MEIIKAFHLQAYELRYPDRRISLDGFVAPNGRKFSLVDALADLNGRLVQDPISLMYEAVEDNDTLPDHGTVIANPVVADGIAEHGLLLSELSVEGDQRSARAMLANFNWGDRALIHQRTSRNRVITNRIEPSDITTREAAAVLVLEADALRGALVVQIRRTRMIPTSQLQSLLNRALNLRMTPNGATINASRRYRVTIVPVMREIDLRDAIAQGGIREVELRRMSPTSDPSRRIIDRFDDRLLQGTRKKFSFNVLLKNPNREIFLRLVEGRDRRSLLNDVGALLGIQTGDQSTAGEFESIRITVVVEDKPRTFVLTSEGLHDEFPYQRVADWPDVGGSLEETPDGVWQNLEREAHSVLSIDRIG